MYRAIVPLQNISLINRSKFIIRLINYDYFSSSSVPAPKPTMRKQMRMDSLPNYRLPYDYIEYEAGKTPSITIQDKLT